MIAIEISDSDPNGFVAVDLQDLLMVLPGEAKHLWWSILEFEATGDLGPSKNMLDFENQIKASPLGLQMQWDQLIGLANSIFQVINATIVGITAGNQFPGFVHSEITALSEIVIQMIDSSVWIVAAQDENVIRTIEKRFLETSVRTY